MELPGVITGSLLNFVLRVQASRSPEFIIGSSDNPLLLRWYLIPRNRVFNIYLHQVVRSDQDIELHDHPWWNCSILLKGSYREVLSTGVRDRHAGEVIFRRASALHRLELINKQPATTLFVTGLKIREWGFQCPNGWVHWKDFTKPGVKGEVGRGCGD